MTNGSSANNITVTAGGNISARARAYGLPEIKVDGQELLVMREDDIMAVIE